MMLTLYSDLNHSLHHWSLSPARGFRLGDCAWPISEGLRAACEDGTNLPYDHLGGAGGRSSRGHPQLESLSGSFPGLTVVGIAASGEELLEHLAEWKPQVILQDLLMPGGMDGIETTRRILERAPR